MEKRTLTKKDIDKVRDIEGFPIGTDGDIIALSEAPDYTACPNPYIEEFMNNHGHSYSESNDDYRREPFASDVSEGKSEPIYRAHSYHTKVPYKAIMRYILHYTNPGDVIFDGFAGSGMTGVAAQMCGNPSAELKYEISHEMSGEKIQWGDRYAVLSDLSPIASYIDGSYNLPHDDKDIYQNLNAIIDNCISHNSWMYETHHMQNGAKVKDVTGKYITGKINFTIWSDVLICPQCGEELIFWNTAVEKEKGKIRTTFECPRCHASLTKKECKHAQEIKYDSSLRENVSYDKQVPVLINYTCGGKKYEKTPDSEDLSLLDSIEKMDIPWFHPVEKWPEGEKTQEPKNSGLNYVHQIYYRRSLRALSSMYDECRSKHLMVILTKIVNRLTKMYRLTYMGNTWGAGGGPMNGAMYVPSLVKEINVCKQLEENKADIVTILSVSKRSSSIVSTQSLTDFRQIGDNYIDYIFTVPPFGANINYSELSSIWEAWIKVKTNTQYEAIINKTQGKALPEYQNLMQKCFSEYYRVLKPGHWMTVEFHNSKNSVWNSIQEALARAGFIVADIRVINKGVNSFNQNNAQGAVKQDLVINVYKPRENFLKSFETRAGDIEMAWEFVRQHLSQLPISPDANHNGKIDIVPERQAYLLYDRMVAWHIMHGVAIPMGSNDFYKGLDERFIKRDEMYFLPEQINEYDHRRSVMELDNVQMAFAIQDEKSAIQWLDYQLSIPQTYSELQPKYLQELHQIRSEQIA